MKFLRGKATFLTVDKRVAANEIFCSFSFTYMDPWDASGIFTYIHEMVDFFQINYIVGKNIRTSPMGSYGDLLIMLLLTSSDTILFFGLQGFCVTDVSPGP